MGVQYMFSFNVNVTSTIVMKSLGVVFLNTVEHVRNDYILVMKVITIGRNMY